MVTESKALAGCTASSVVSTPIGMLEAGAGNEGLRYLNLIRSNVVSPLPENEHTAMAVRQLEEYFAGKRKVFELTLDFTGHSDFSVRVWHRLMQIPYGTTITYAALATDLGDIKCIRAAASANGRNPIPVIVPCHRVIGSDGSLTGFALGLDVKHCLLALENPEKFAPRQLELGF